MASYTHFHELPVYKYCRAYRKQISEIVKTLFPKQEEYRLTSQILKAGRSVTANIAEGFGRFHHQENILFCRQARGSLHQTPEHLITGFDEGYIPEPLLQQFLEHHAQCLKQLNAYIKYLLTAKSSPPKTNNQ